MILFILNDPPYGSERTYNGLRLAGALLKAEANASVVVFLLGDAVVGAKRGQTTPEGYYNVERMLRRVVLGKGRVLLCGTCMDARALYDEELVDGGQRSSLDELAALTVTAEKVLVF